MSQTEIKSEEKGIVKEIIKQIKRMKEKAFFFFLQRRKTTNLSNLLGLNHVTVEIA